MHTYTTAISDFVILRPPYESTQEHNLLWIEAAHTQAEATKRSLNGHEEEMILFRQELKERLWHVGCKPGSISFRGHVIPDVMSEKWDEMQVYRLLEYPQGVSLQQRQLIHREHADRFFSELYNHPHDRPDDILHVSCTGYASPSGAQKIVSKNKWEGHTSVTHLYHMGCYASLPGIRVGSAISQRDSSRVDVVHTELCSLHMNPLQHSSSQLVFQSLFGDGIIKYSFSPEKTFAKTGKPYLRICGLLEYVIPDTTRMMEWLLGDWAFQFVLSKEIPVVIAKALQDYIEALCRKSGVDSVKQLIKNAIFAIHPGGPKILDYVQKIFAVEDCQMQISRDILNQYGNMSSATLPHIWEKVCSDPRVLSGTKILSLAFGPGLTIAGAILEKEG